METAAKRIQASIEAFIASDGAKGEFEALALEVFAFQYEHVAPYRRYCDSRGVTPAMLPGWDAIPALPTDAFKHRLVSEQDRPYVFVSSGTTSGPEHCSRHALSSLSTYRVSAMRHFERMVLPDAPGPMATLLLGPSSASHPHSSLGQMFSWCIEEFAGEERLQAFDGAGQVDVRAAVAWLQARAASATPVLVAGVTSALSALFAFLRAEDLTLRLPADSRVVDTGGAKSGAGPVRVLSPRALLKASWRFLHVPAYLCVNEYGMTEMLSQFYDDSLLSRYEGRFTPRAKLGPKWVRTTIVDPVTLAPVAAGEPGLLRHLDLANWQTVSALQTLDVGRACGRGFELLGRAAGVQARGCSQLMSMVTGEATQGSRDTAP